MKKLVALILKDWNDVEDEPGIFEKMLIGETFSLIPVFNEVDDCGEPISDEDFCDDDNPLQVIISSITVSKTEVQMTIHCRVNEIHPYLNSSREYDFIIEDPKDLICNELPNDIMNEDELDNQTRKNIEQLRGVQ